MVKCQFESLYQGESCAIALEENRAGCCFEASLADLRTGVSIIFRDLLNGVFGIFAVCGLGEVGVSWIRTCLIEISSR